MGSHGLIAIALVACSELYSAYSLPSACYSFKVAVRSAIRVAVRVLVGALVRAVVGAQYGPQWGL